MPDKPNLHENLIAFDHALDSDRREVDSDTPKAQLDADDVRALLDAPRPQRYPIVRLGRLVVYSVVVETHKDELLEPAVVVKVHPPRTGEEVPRVNLQVFHSALHNGTRLFEDVAYDPDGAPGTWALPY